MCVALVFSPLSDKSGTIHSTLLIPVIYLMTSIVIAAVIFIAGIKGRMKGFKGLGYCLVVAVNGIYLFVSLFIICFRWNTMMSV